METAVCGVLFILVVLFISTTSEVEINRMAKYLALSHTYTFVPIAIETLVLNLRSRRGSWQIQAPGYPGLQDINA